MGFLAQILGYFHAYAVKFQKENTTIFVDYVVVVVAGVVVVVVLVVVVVVVISGYIIPTDQGLDLARFIFFVLRNEVCLGHETLDPVLRIAAWSFNVTW